MRRSVRSGRSPIRLCLRPLLLLGQWLGPGPAMLIECGHIAPHTPLAHLVNKCVVRRLTALTAESAAMATLNNLTTPDYRRHEQPVFSMLSFRVFRSSPVKSA
jgi:hypothetical protein